MPARGAERRPHVVVVGSINMDLVVRVPRLPRPGETLPANDLQTIPGGKGANQAVAAARLGARVTMIGRVGDDPFGPRLRSSLEAEGIATEHVVVTEGCPSGVAIIGVEDSGQNAILIVAGANGRLTPQDVLAREEVLRTADVVLLQLEVPVETVEATVALARRSAVPVVLDPAPVPRGPLPRALWEVDVLTPNQTEAEGLTGLAVSGPPEAERAARLLRERGVNNIVVKLGAWGALLCDPDGLTALIPAEQVTVVDTTAAGDAFNAALAVGLCEGLALPAAVRLGCAAGTLATTRAGAQPAMPTRTEVECFLDRCGPEGIRSHHA
jgi:ribokinase